MFHIAECVGVGVIVVIPHWVTPGGVRTPFLDVLYWKQSKTTPKIFSMTYPFDLITFRGSDFWSSYKWPLTYPKYYHYKGRFGHYHRVKIQCPQNLPNRRGMTLKKNLGVVLDCFQHETPKNDVWTPPTRTLQNIITFTYFHTFSHFQPSTFTF